MSDIAAVEYVLTVDCREAPGIVTADLDEGPIIAQEVIAVDHSHTPDDLAAIGRDAESAALARAVRWHCEGRVFVQGRRTVVLR